jgi:hypothetical protein
MLAAREGLVDVVREAMVEPTGAGWQPIHLDARRPSTRRIATRAYGRGTHLFSLWTTRAVLDLSMARKLSSTQCRRWGC